LPAIPDPSSENAVAALDPTAWHWDDFSFARAALMAPIE
jgi:hypothetical protein